MAIIKSCSGTVNINDPKDQFCLNINTDKTYKVKVKNTGNRGRFKLIIKKKDEFNVGEPSVKSRWRIIEKHKVLPDTTSSGEFTLLPSDLGATNLESGERIRNASSTVKITIKWIKTAYKAHYEFTLCD